MAELVEEFVAELPAKVAAIERGLAEQDFGLLATLAHQLKEAAGGYGFPSITETAKALEQTSKIERDLGKLTKEVKSLATHCDRAQTAPTEA